MLPTELWVCGSLVVANLVSRLSGADIARLDVDREMSIPTFWSSLQLAFLTTLCGIRARAAAGSGEPWKPWALVAACAGFITLDEALEIHEILINPMRSMFNASGFFHLAWIIPYSAIALVVGAILLPWISRLPVRTRNGLLLAAVLFVLGAIVMEGIGGSIIERDAIDSTSYTFATSVEEGLEMIAVVVGIRAVLGDLIGTTAFTLELGS